MSSYRWEAEGQDRHSLYCLYGNLNLLTYVSRAKKALGTYVRILDESRRTSEMVRCLDNSRKAFPYLDSSASASEAT